MLDHKVLKIATTSGLSSSVAAVKLRYLKIVFYCCEAAHAVKVNIRTSCSCIN